jgi:hypothetical protein
MNVTQEILTKTELYGGTPSARPEYFSTSKNLDYALGSNSLTHARSERITAIPQDIYYRDTVGLQGSENTFVKIDLNITNTLGKATSGSGEIVNTYEPVSLALFESDNDTDWSDVIVDFQLDLNIFNTYEPARFNNVLDTVAKGLVSVELENLKTGNKYIDAWLDVRLYTKDRKEYAYDKMYIDPKSYFYIGFHARNTRRIPYNVQLKIGRLYLSENDLPEAEFRYLVK